LESREVQVHFEEVDSLLTAVEIDRAGRSPVIVSLHRALFALGIVISSYQVRAVSNGLVERVVIERQDGGSLDGSLSARARAAVLPIALRQTAG
jgi:citrate lyase gamma subunit